MLPPAPPLAASLGLLLLQLHPGGRTPILTNEQIPLDNIKDRHVHFETAPIQPLSLAPDGSFLFAVNQPGARLSLLDPATLSRQFEVQIGLGAVTVVARPGTS